MKTVLALIYLALTAALFASTTDRYTPAWTALAAVFGVLMVAAFVRVVLVTNGTEEVP